MTTPLNAENNFNELIFEDRNKEYGAYALRKSQANTVTQSMIISLSGVTLIVFSIFMFGKGTEKLNVSTPNIIPDLPSGKTVIITPPDKPKEKITPLDPLPPKTESGKIVASNDPEKKLNKTNEELNISKNPNDTGSDSVKGTDPEIPERKDPPVENTDPKTWVDQMPEFDGNVYQFIKDHLRYPQIAVENGTQGTVGLSFIVEKDGSIGDIKIVNDIRDGCTQEAMRVLRLMPKWKPGLNHGMPVRVIFNLPVKFRLGK